MRRRSRVPWPGIMAGMCALALVLLPTGLAGSAAHSDGSAAPGGPGTAGTWQTGRKMDVGTAYARRSNVWFTITDAT